MKRNKIMFVIAIVAMLAVLFVACDDKGNHPEHTHTYGAWNIATQPTEDAAGTATRACACGETETTTVAKLSDTTVWTVTVSQDATHETAGFKAYKSDAFGTVTLTFPKGEHVYGAWEISKEPTKENTGVAIRKCACGHFEEATLAVLTNTSVWTLNVEGATHETTGKEIYTSEYGVVTIVTEVQQHVYGAWVDNHDGTHSRTCSCGDRQTEDCVYDQEVAAPDFFKSAATCTAKAVYYKSCVCGAVDKSADAATFEVGTANGHDYYNFQVVSEPTCTEAGQVVADCRNCDQKYNGTIPALGHDFSGECIPYVDDISYGDEDEGGTSYDGSEYHVHTCTRCDAVDTAHKEAHALGAAVYTLHLVHGTDDMYEVWAKYSCEKCSYSTTVTDEFNRYIGQDDSWTLVEEVEADYNQAGHATWRFSDGREITVYTDKLVGQYEGTTYVGLELRKSEDTSAISSYTTGASVTFDKNGYAVGAAAPFMGDNTVRIINAVTGELTYVTDNKGSHYEDTGAIDFEHGVIVRSSFGDWERAVVMIPSTMNVNVSAVSGSYWTDSMALSFDATCSLGETHTYNVFVYNEKVYFNAQFVDMDGKAIAAKNCANASYVKVLDAEGNQIQAFAQKNGTLKETDGKEGYYSFDSGNVVLNGVGGVLVSGTEGGSYTAAAESASYGYDVYIGESVESATAYYRLTLGESHTCTLVKPMATLSFRTNVEGNEVADVSVNINVTVTLPVPADREGYMYGGWMLDGEGDATTTFKATEEGNEYRFETLWNKCSTIVANDLLDADKDNYNGVYVAVGSAYTSVLPAYTENTFRNGYKFAGWYLDDGDGVLDVNKDQPLDDTTLVEEFDAQFVIFASWEWAGEIEFVEQSRYAWEYIAESNTWRSTNTGKGSTSSVMEVKWTSGVSRIEFDYWVDGEKGYDYLTIYYYDVDGVKQTINTKANNISKDNAVHIVCVLDGEGESLRLSYGKDGSGDNGQDRAFVVNLTINGERIAQQAALNKNAGVYTAEGAESINVGAGGLVTIGENSYAYSNVSDNTIGVMVGEVYREYTLNVAAKTYTVVEPKVNVSYNYNGHGENSTVEVGKYSNQTLASAPTADGFIFRGWYTDEELTTAASATFVASSDVTFYAKWDAAVILTFDYSGYAHDGTNTTSVVSGKYVNDTVGTLPTIETSIRYNGQAFAGWFFKNEDGTFGDQATASYKLTANTTIYAKWITPNFLAGSYKGYNVYGTTSTTATSKSLTIDIFGNASSGVSGAVSDYNEETGFFKIGSRFAYYDATNNMIVVGGTNGEFGTDVYFFFAADSVVTAKENVVTWNSSKSRLVAFTINETVVNVLLDNNNVYYGVSWTAKDVDDKAVTDIKAVMSDADQLDIVVGEEATVKLAKNNNKVFVTRDGYEGVYDNAGQTIRINGAGIVTLMNDVKGTYTKTPDGTEYTFDVNTDDATYKLTVDKEAGTWEIAENRVTISFENDKVVVEDMSPYYGKKATLPAGDAVKFDGFVFRGWYDNAEFTGSAQTTVTLTENAKYYAKYDPAVTLTFDYSGYEYEEGKTTSVVSGKYKNDKLGTLPTVAASVRHEGKVFVGWFLKDAEGNFAEQVSANTVLSDDTTVYAKWIAPAASMGTYKAWNLCSSTESGTKSSSGWGTSLLTISADGSYTGSGLTAGKLTAEQMQLMDGVMVLSNGKSYHYFNVSLGMVWRNYYSTNASGVGNDTYIGLNTDIVASVDYSGCKGAEGSYIAYFKITYKDGSTKYAFLYNSMIVEVSGFNDANNTTITDVTKIKDATVFVYGLNNAVFAKVADKKVIENDGKGGTYTSADAYGDIVIDGFGTLTVNGESVAYTLDGDKVSFVAGNAMRSIVLGDGTYTKALDKYQGTYTLPDETTMELDGYGNVTGTTKTYVVSGSTITIYDGEASQAYGIDVDGKAFLGKSKFAGLKFDKSSSDYIEFEDGVDIKGKMVCGYSSWYIMFTGVYDAENGTLTLTVVSESGTGAKVGQTITFTVSDGKLVLNNEKPFQYVSITKGYTYTNSTFKA